MSVIEYRVRRSAPTANDDNRLSGRAAPFNSPTMIGRAPWGFREQISPKAFNKSLEADDQVLLDNHDASRPLARVSAETLELHPSRKGLDWQASVSDTSYARDVMANVKAKNYGGCSFSFEVVSDTWDESEDVPLRTLNEVNLREISIVTFPAYNDTTVSARDVAETAMEFRWGFYEREIMEWRADSDGDDKKPYGDETYADPKNGKYPLTKDGKLSSERIHAAWAYINVAKNAEKYPLNGVTLSSVKSKIKAAAKKIGMDISSDDSESNSELIVVDARDGLQISFDSEFWTEEARSRYLSEEKWINVLAQEPEGEPSRLTKEEVASLSSQASDFRRKQYALRKAQMEGK